MARAIEISYILLYVVMQHEDQESVYFSRMLCKNLKHGILKKHQWWNHYDTPGQSRILCKLQKVVQIEQNLCKTGAAQAAAALFIK